MKSVSFNKWLEKKKKTWSLWGRIDFWIRINIVTKFRNITGICPHESSFGRIKDKKDTFVHGLRYTCLDCGRFLRD